MTAAQYISRVRGCLARGGKWADLAGHYRPKAKQDSASRAVLKLRVGAIVLGEVKPHETDEKALTAWERQVHGTGGKMAEAEAEVEAHLDLVKS